MPWRKTQAWLTFITILVFATIIMTPALAASAGFAETKTPSPDNSETGGSVRLLMSDESSIRFEIIVPAYQLETGTIAGETCQRLNVAGFNLAAEAGWPQLPVLGTMLAIPPGVEPVVQVLEVEQRSAPGIYNLCPAPKQVVQIGLDGQVESQDWEAYHDPAAYNLDEFTPQELVELSDTGFLRSQHFAQLYTQPFQYNPTSGELRYATRLLVELTWEEGKSPLGTPSTSANAGTFVDEGAFETTLQGALLNYDSSRGWRQAPVPSPQTQPGAAAESLDSSTFYKVLVNQDGIYQLSYSDLGSAGVPVGSLDPRTFQLYNQGTEVAIYVPGEDDGIFSPGESLIFYGQKMNSIYTDTNVYWLTWGVQNGLRMPTSNGTTAPGTPEGYFTTTVRVEENHIYNSSRPSGLDNDRWYWGYIYSTSGSAQFATVSTTLNHIAHPAGQNITVRGVLRSFSGIPEHHTKVYLNNNLINEATWSNNTDYSFEVNVPNSYLVEGVNQIKIDAPLDGGISENIVFYNWFEIAYFDTYTAESDWLRFINVNNGTLKFRLDGFSASDIRVFDITNPGTVARVINGDISDAGGSYDLTFDQNLAETHEYLATLESTYLSPLDIVLDSPSSLEDPNNGAEYIVITHADFMAATQPLVNYRASQGLQTQMVDVQDIYDEFNDGILDAEAIHDFLAYAYNNWDPAPLYVLIMGDSTYDFLDYYGYGDQVYVPTYLLDIDPWLGETAADNRFVTVSGSDILPDIHLGRLTANSVSQVQAMVDKILSYAQNPPTEDWNREVLFVADDTDSGGNFPTLSDDIVNNHLPPEYNAEKAYYKITYANAGDMKSAILNGVNAGRLMVSYIGHSNQKQWAQESFLHVDDIPSFTNSDRLTFIVPMTCLEGYYINPSGTYDQSSLGESIVRADSKGAIASFSPTGYGVATGHDIMERELFDTLLTDGLTLLGPATTQSKVHLYNSTPQHRELIDAYLLFGDPVTDLEPQTGQSISVNPGWNLNSVPLQAVDMSLGALFPDVVDPAYRFNGAYQPVNLQDPLVPGEGYWTFFNEAHTYEIGGEVVQTKDIPVEAGWNLIGPFENAVQVSAISSTPGGILQPPVYGFDSSYLEVTTLQPGKGYWAYAGQAGTLHLGSSGELGTTVAIPLEMDSCDLTWTADLQVQDSRGNAQKLTIGLGPSMTDELNWNCAEKRLPPIPPVGVFDVRLILQSGDETSRVDYRSILSNSVNWNLAFQLTDDGYPVTLHWDPNTLPGGQWLLQDPVNGSIINVDMRTVETYSIKYPEINNLVIRYTTANPLYLNHLALVLR